MNVSLTIFAMCMRRFMRHGQSIHIIGDRWTLLADGGDYVDMVDNVAWRYE